MANLFEINKAIQDTWNACIDPETGEINEDLYAKMEELQMEVRKTAMKEFCLLLQMERQIY